MAAFAAAMLVFGLSNRGMAAWMFGRGQVLQVDVEEMTTWTTKDDGGHVETHHGFKGSLGSAAGRRPVDAEVEKTAHGRLSEALKSNPRIQVPFWQWRGILSPGTHPGISITLGVFDLSMSIVMLILFTVMSFVSRGWYERGTVDETEVHNEGDGPGAA
jgi:hypothetical protein